MRREETAERRRELETFGRQRLGLGGGLRDGDDRTYRVPKILEEIRRVRRDHMISQMSDLIPPTVMYARCEEETDSEGVARALYTHAFIEAGFILDGPQSAGGKPYGVCPVCGYVF